MAIPIIDFFDFLFNLGRGIRKNQVAWDDPADDADFAAEVQRVIGMNVQDVQVTQMGNIRVIRPGGGREPDRRHPERAWDEHTRPGDPPDNHHHL